MAAVTKLLLNPRMNKKKRDISPDEPAIVVETYRLLTEATIKGMIGMRPKMAKLKKVTILFPIGFSSSAINCSS